MAKASTLIPGWQAAPRAAAPKRVRAYPVALALVAVVVAAGWVARSTLPATERAWTPTNTFAHWQGQGHDWLLKAEPGQGRVVVYDATDGRPLKRLPAPGVTAIELEGRWLFVMGTQSPGLRLLRLPQLTWRSGETGRDMP